MARKTKNSAHDIQTKMLNAECVESCKGRGKLVYVLLHRDWARKGRIRWELISTEIKGYLDRGPDTFFSFLTADEVTAGLTPSMTKKLNLSALEAGQVRSIARCRGYSDGRNRSWSRQTGFLRVLALRSQSPMAREIRAYVKARKNAEKIASDAEIAFRREAREALLPVVNRHLNHTEEWVEAYLAKLGFGADILTAEEAIPETPCFYTGY